MTIFVALGLGLLYWIAEYDTILTNSLKWPLFVGLLLGLLFGDVKTGLYIGASIEMIFIVNTSVGGNLPADKTIATFVSVPIAILSNMEPEMALAIAVPLATLAKPLDDLRRMINVYWNKKASHDIDKLNITQLKLDAWVYPALVQLPLRVIPVTLLLYFGAGSADAIVSALPEWVTHGLNILGGILPAMGMVACVRMIGRKNLLPYFLLGYFASEVFGLESIVLAIFAGIIAFITIGGPDGFKATTDTLSSFAGGEAEDRQLKRKLSKKALRKARYRGVFAHRIAQDMENFYGTGFCVAAQPCLEELYGDDPEAYKAALHRHLVPYITEPTWGACIQGAAMAMEEQIANGADIDPSMVVSLRTGLMGPFAGLGDTINGYILKPIVNSIGISMALAGNPLGVFPAFWPLVFQNFIVGYNMFDLGYKLGKNSLLKLLKGGWIDKIMVGAGILGMTMMGGLTSKYVKLSTIVDFQLSTGETYILQDYFDMLLPGLLPLVLFFVSYWYMSRPKANYTKLVVIFFAISLLGSLAGII